MSLDSINEEFERKRGKPGGYPEDMHYFVTEKTDGTLELCVKDAGKDDDVWKLADPWGIAAFADVQKKLKNAPLGLHFAMLTPSDKEIPRHEALKRRVSYLAEANKARLPIVLTVGGQKESLYSISELANRTVKHTGEVVQTEFEQRGDGDIPGRPEKDWQTYLFGKGLHEGEEAKPRTNERLVLLGDDFADIGKKRFGVEREWPTGVFREEIKDPSRILPTEYIDLVTINKSSQIAIIELKLNKNPLESIAQLLNYALFFHSYKKQLASLLDERLLLDKHPQHSSAGFSIKAYLVSNVFHKRLADVWHYYIKGPIAMQQVRMGYYLPDNRM
jgi:hypothetical protein